MRLIAAVGLALMIFGMNSAFAKGGENNTLRLKPNGTPGTIRYAVEVILSDEVSPCNIYWVTMSDFNNNLIAAPQVYIPGKKIYNFYEQGPKFGVRIARFVMSPNLDGKVCNEVLYALPSVWGGLFEGGESYPFQLVPMHRLPKFIE